MKKLLTVLFVSFALLSAEAQTPIWKSINPGAGGQVQDVVCDPNVNERLILASDMEGIYESLDNGDSWKPKGVLHQNRVYAVTIPHANTGDAAYKAEVKNRMYVGTLFGLEVSTDGGDTFTLIQQTKKKSIGAIAIHPTNKQIVLAAIGWRDDYDDAGGGKRFYQLFDTSFKNGKVTVFKSEDGGVSWSEKTTTDSYGDRNVFSITFDPTDGTKAYLASDAGVFKSTNTGNNWTQMGAPGGTNGNAKGVAISPDGKVIYATYQTNASANNGLDQGENLEVGIYATRTSSTSWKSVMGSGTGLTTNYSFWLPEVDPRSTGSTHKVIVSMDQERKGLFEGTISWNSNYTNENPSSKSWTQAWTESDVTSGWDPGRPNCRFAHYTPNVSGWSKAIWSTQNQTIYRGAANGSSYTWQNKYSTTNNQNAISYYGIANIPTYGSRGTESTYTWDIDAYGDYVIQGQGDNGTVESWDGGTTWSNIWMRDKGQILSDVQAVKIVQSWIGKVVLAQMTAGYGGNAFSGNLYAKKNLSGYDEDDSWELYAGGSAYRGGLPNGLYSDIAESPASPGKIFVFSRGHGLYTQDFGWAYDQHQNGNEPWFTLINGGELTNTNVKSVKKIAPHPTNPNIVFLSAVDGNKQGVYRGTYNESTDVWNWSHVLSGSGWDAEVDAWEHNGQVYLFYSGRRPGSDGDGSNFVGAISLDNGDNWKTVLRNGDTRSEVSHNWYNSITNGSQNNYVFQFENKGGLVGYDDKVIMAHYDHTLQKTYAVLQGTVSGNPNNINSWGVNWNDFTADIPFGGLTTARVVTGGTAANPTKKLYVGTAGAGGWVRNLNGGSTPPSNQAPSVSLTAPNNNSTINSGSNVTVSANASDSDGSISKVEFYRNSTKIGEDSNAPYSVTWNNASQGSYALTAIAYDNDNATTTSSVRNVTVNTPSGGCTASGTILMEKYDGISGTAISALTGASIYPNSPSSTSQLSSFEITSNVGDNFGVRVRGLICAPETGSYTFWIAGDDAVELWLSSNSNASSKSKIASHTGWTNSREWNKFSAQKSSNDYVDRRTELLCRSLDERRKRRR